MADIWFYSDNDDFKQDLQNQINRFVPDVKFNAEKPDIILIDGDKAQYNKWREDYPNVPIVYLGVEKENTEDCLDIVLKKPVRLMQLLDILRATNNKFDYSGGGNLQFNHYELRPSQKEIVDLDTSNTTKLTAKEVDILKYLYKNAGLFVSKNDLQTNVWKYNEEVTTHTIETHIYRLRQKVEKKSRRLILTDGGCYKLITDE